MKQIWIPRKGAPEVLEVREAPDPEPGPGQVRIRVEAAGVNFADLMARMGMYPDAPPLPTVVGYEVAGTIDAVGEGVDSSRIGVPVVALTRFGGYSSVVVVDDVQASVRPDGLDAITGAAIPVTGLTAWMMLEEMGRVRAGDRVLVHSAAGGVGLMALDLIKFRDGIAVGTASGSKHEWLLDRGYSQLIDYRTQDFEEELKDGPGFDLILDPVGGASWAKGLRLLRPGGRMVCFGFSASIGGTTGSTMQMLRTAMAVPWLKINPLSLMDQNKGVMGVNLGHMWDESVRVRQWLDQLLERWKGGHLHPHVHTTVPFSEAAEAHAIIHRRESRGKIILIPD